MKFPREEKDADGKEEDGDKEKEMNKQKFRVHFTAV